MKSIDYDDPELFTRLVDFAQIMSTRSITQGGDEDTSDQVLCSEFPELMNHLSLHDFVKMAVDNVKANPMSHQLSKVIAVVRAMLSTKVGSSADASLLLLDSKLNFRGVSIKTCREALALFGSLGANDGSKEQLMMLISSRFPFAKDL
jgi:hypothetical protein